MRSTAKTRSELRHLDRRVLDSGLPTVSIVSRVYGQTFSAHSSKDFHALS